MRRDNKLKCFESTKFIEIGINIFSPIFSAPIATFAAYPLSNYVIFRQTHMNSSKTNITFAEKSHKKFPKSRFPIWKNLYNRAGFVSLFSAPGKASFLLPPLILNDLYKDSPNQKLVYWSGLMLSGVLQAITTFPAREQQLEALHGHTTKRTKKTMRYYLQKEILRTKFKPWLAYMMMANGATLYAVDRAKKNLHEKHDEWSTGRLTFTASMLAIPLTQIAIVVPDTWATRKMSSEKKQVTFKNIKIFPLKTMFIPKIVAGASALATIFFLRVALKTVENGFFITLNDSVKEMLLTFFSVKKQKPKKKPLPIQQQSCQL